MASLKQQLRERFGYLDQGTRERVIADTLDTLDRPTLLMVEEGKRAFDDLGLYVETRSRYGPAAPSLPDLVEVVFVRMVDAGRRGA